MTLDMSWLSPALDIVKMLVIWGGIFGAFSCFITEAIKDQIVKYYKKKNRKKYKYIKVHGKRKRVPIEVYGDEGSLLMLPASIMVSAAWTYLVHVSFPDFDFTFVCYALVWFGSFGIFKWLKNSDFPLATLIDSYMSKVTSTISDATVTISAASASTTIATAEPTATDTTGTTGE